ncbi:DoxX family protein [Moraxella sp. FZLJ2107]|uniref:DoxX family protein n=1 Tax=unclassified Moraxella TaxID=2685852 RepID=UPI00209C2863|nr:MULTISPECIES: DoxX family protein [unclassified Moraxella]USZ14402.1 DoxX family protein [Moraxella sp. FZFQ2102]UTO05073.1 DoxX family protein [Moraxella sp. FZLJ2107]UTO21808.1 DoxX family protein [Moraxella sp. FZLJ2109]
MYHSFEKFSYNLKDLLLLFTRVIIGYMYLLHGTTKLFAMPAAMAGDKGAVELFSMMGVGGVLELVGGALLIIGLFTRFNAFIQAGMMAVAYFFYHAFPAGIDLLLLPSANRGENAVVYCMIFLLFWALGAGKYSLDAKFSKY